MTTSGHTSRSRLPALLWGLAVAGVCLWLGVQVLGGPVIDGDLTALLPSAESDRSVDEAIERFEDRQARKLVVLVSAAQMQSAREAADQVYADLQDSGQFARLQLKRPPGALRDLWDFYHGYRFSLLSQQARANLRANDEAALKQALLQRYSDPLLNLSSSMVEADPLLFLLDYLKELDAATRSRVRLQDGYLTVEAEGQTHILILGELAQSPFSLKLQDGLAPILQNLRSSFSGEPDSARVAIAGVLPYAIAGTASAKREITLVGFGSLAGVVLLFLFAFRSLKPLALTLLSIAIGCAGGFAACLTIFGQVHILTLVFGASIVGISVDYSLHYFCHLFHDEGERQRGRVLADIFPGITLGLLTSLIGFGGLLLAPFSGLREMAVFSSAGLIFAYLSVVLFHPLAIASAARSEGFLYRSAAGYWRALGNRRSRPFLFAGLLLAVAAAALGFSRLAVTDDVRSFQALDPQIKAEEARVRDLVGEDFSLPFLMVSGRDEEALLQREEDLAGALSELVQAGQITGYLALSDFVPSLSRQGENRRLISRIFEDDARLLKDLSGAIGLSPAVYGSYRQDFASSGAAQTLEIRDFYESEISAPVRDLWQGRVEKQVFSVIRLRGIAQPEVLDDLAREATGVSYVDNARDLSRLFETYRVQTLGLTAALYLLVALVLLLRYGVWGGLCVIAVPLGAAVACFGLLGLLTEPISIFNIMALLLILGIGVDYGIFFRESGSISIPTLLAVAMSSLTTILAFGLLTLSTTAAVHSFGVTVLIGIFSAFLLSPLALLAPLQSRKFQGKGK